MEEGFVVPLKKIEPEAVLEEKELGNIGEYIIPSLVRYPVYQYQTGSTFYLSKTERIVVDAYLETNSESASARALNKLLDKHGTKRHYSVMAISRWLKKPHVARYVGEMFQDRGKVNWFDKPKWEAWGVDVMQAKKEATSCQMVAWREYGKAKGWYVDPGQHQGPQTNVMINFTQNSGRS